MTEIKFCGINEPAAMAAVLRTGAEYAGFNFIPASPRAVTPAQAAALLQPGPKPVGLLLDPSDAEIAEILAALPLAALQIYAPQPRAAAIRARFAVPVWWVAGIATAEDLPHAAPGIDRILLDRKPPPGAALPGGNAERFDWAALRHWHAPAPWILAGGLTPANVAGAIRQTGAPTVDVASGIERTRGVKDPALIEAFAAAVRTARSPQSLPPRNNAPT